MCPNQKEKKKILFISHCCVPERIGGATHNFEMAKELSERGYIIDFVTTQPSYPFGEFTGKKEKKKEKINKNFRIFRLFTYRPQKSNPSFFERVLWFSIFSLNATLFVALKSIFSDYDLIITSIPNEPSLLPGFIGKKIFNKKWVIDIRDLWFENAIELGQLNGNGLIARLFKKFRGASFQQADGLTYTAQTIVDELEKNGYRLPDKKIFNPNGFDPEMYPTSKERENRVLYVGNVGLAYELELVVDAILYSKMNNWTLVIRGGGDLLGEIKQRVKRLNLSNKVKFIPPIERDELLQLISRSKIGVCPLKNKKSLASVIPTKVIEYMGCGIPVISSGPGEVEKLVNESNAGLHVKSTAKAYAKAIDTLFENRELYEEMSNNAIRYANKYFNKKEVIINIDKFLQQI